MRSDLKNYLLRNVEILKTKEYTLLLEYAAILAKLMRQLEQRGIANTKIVKTEYSRSAELEQVLRAKTSANAKEYAKGILSPFGQQPGKAIYVFGLGGPRTGNAIQALAGTVPGLVISNGLKKEQAVANEIEPLQIDFDKLTYTCSLIFRFKLD